MYNLKCIRETYITDLILSFLVQWARPTSASTTFQQAAAAWAAPTASLLRTPLTCTGRVTHWAAAPTRWRSGRGPSAVPVPSETARTKVGDTLWNTLSKMSSTNVPSDVDAIRDHFRGPFSLYAGFNGLSQCVRTGGELAKGSLRSGLWVGSRRSGDLSSQRSAS